MTRIIPMRSEGRYESKDLERLVNELYEHQQHKEVMHAKEAAAFLGIGLTSLYKCKDIPHHTLPGLEGRIYLKDELIDFIKQH